MLLTTELGKQESTKAKVKTRNRLMFEVIMQAGNINNHALNLAYITARYKESSRNVSPH